MQARNKARILCAICLALLLIAMTAMLLSCGDGDHLPEDGSVNVAQTHPTQWLPTEPEKAPVAPDDGVYALYTVNSSTAGYLKGNGKQKLGEGVVSEEVTAMARMGYCFVKWSDGVTEPTRSGDSFSKTTVVTAIFDYDYYDMPIVLLTTETGKEVQSKTEYIDGTFALINAGEDVLNMADPVPNEIRGRGNNTWTYEKKSYKIKFAEKQSPLMLGKEETTWVLLANMCDQSLLRNDTALELVDMFDTTRHSPNAQNVEVYLNGEYRGVYLLAEEITEDKAHLDLEDKERETEIDIGYLLEMSYYAETVDFVVAGKNFEIKNNLSTDEETANEQRAHIHGHVQRAWDALRSGKESKVAELIDIDTLVDAYIAEEITKNLDMGWDSFYLYKDAGGKLCFGPLWDFDLSFGNGDETCQYYTELYCGRRYLDHLSNPWFYTAMEHDWFRAKVTARWDEMYDKLTKLSESVLAKGAKDAASYDRNFVKWPIFGQCMNRETELIMSLQSHKEHYTYLAQWIDDRIDWLDDFYHSDEYASGAWRYEDQFAKESLEAEELGWKLGKEAVDLHSMIDQKSIHATMPGVAPNEGAEMLLDGNSATKYCLQHTHTVHVTFRTKEPVSLVGFSVTTGGDTDKFPERNPQTFALYGSSNGQDWTPLRVVGYGHDILGAESELEYGFAIEDSGEYRYFRFGFNNNELMQLAEVTLYGAK